jgi:selenoprotein W-related protein
MDLCSWDISGVSLIPADGGAFEVSVGYKLMYSKLETGEFPDESILVDEIRSELFTQREQIDL